MNRKTVVVVVKGALLAQDSTYLGTKDGKRTYAEILKDGATLYSSVAAIGKPFKCCDTLSLLSRLKDRGRLPLVWATDNGSCYVGAAVGRWLAKNRVVHLRNRPHTPQDNGRLERAIGEAKKEWSHETTAGFLREFLMLNRRPRQSKGGSSANQLEVNLPWWKNRVSRGRFFACTRRTVARETRLLAGRPARTAERAAIFDSLLRFGLAKVK